MIAVPGNIESEKVLASLPHHRPLLSTNVTFDRESNAV